MTSVNDVFVMTAWAKATGGEGKITFLSDGNGDFAKAVGLALDGTGFGLGAPRHCKFRRGRGAGGHQRYGRLGSGRHDGSVHGGRTCHSCHDGPTPRGDRHGVAVLIPSLQEDSPGMWDKGLDALVAGT